MTKRTTIGVDERVHARLREHKHATRSDSMNDALAELLDERGVETAKEAPQ